MSGLMQFRNNISVFQTLFLDSMTELETLVNAEIIEKDALKHFKYHIEFMNLWKNIDEHYPGTYSL